MNDNPHIADEDLVLYAIGTLPAAEMQRARSHIEVCARCKEEVRQNIVAFAAYAQATPEAALPEGARNRFLAKIPQSRETRAPRLTKPETAGRSRPTNFGRRFGSPIWAGALAGALAVLLLLVGVDDLRKRAEMGPLLAQAQRGEIDSAQLTQLVELLSSTHARKVVLHETPDASPAPEGRVVYSATKGKLLMTASNLRPLPAGKTYELWILQPGGNTPLQAGTFTPDSDGNAAIILADERANLAVKGFAVTVEKAGGAETPTLPIVLSGL
jgi:anti-sigma-K factor RskA